MSGNIGGFGMQDPNAAFIQAPGAVPGVGPAITSTAFGISTIEKSAAEAYIMLLSAGFPMLTPPQSVATSYQDLASASSSVSGVASASPTQVAMMVEQTKNNIITSMWDTFIKGVREMSERSREEDIKKWTEDVSKNGPKSATEYYAYLMAMSASQRAKELSGDGNALATQFNQTFNTWLVAPSAKMDGMDPTAGFPDRSFVAGSLASNPDLVRNAIGAVGAGVGAQLSISPVADALFAVGPTSGLPADSQAAAAMVTALLNGGAVNKATSESIQQAAKTAQPATDLNFALNYAKNIMNIVTHNVDKGGPLDPQQVTQNQMMKLMLTSMALVLLYRTAYGSITGTTEFTSLLNPATSQNLPEQIQPTVNQLAALLKSYLPTDPQARAETLTNLLAYADKNESVTSMLSTTQIFTGLLKTGDIRSQQLSGG